MRYRLGRLLCALVLVLLACAPVRADEPLLTLVFTGNTLGQFKPCEVCSADKSHGGLDRRSTLFKTLQAQIPMADQLLILGGGHEFLPFKVRHAEPKGLAKALAKAYSILPYDLGYVTPREKSWLEENGARPPKGWLTAGDKPQTQVLDRAGLKVGVVIFPAVDDPFAMPGDAVMSQAARACQALRPQVDLLVAMSPWNERAEMAFMKQHGPVADILLGSGPALASGSRVATNGRTLWLRAFYDGQKVGVLHILEHPMEPGQWQWLEGANFSFEAVSLGPDIKPDPIINNLFAWI